MVVLLFTLQRIVILCKSSIRIRDVLKLSVLEIHKTPTEGAAHSPCYLFPCGSFRIDALAYLAEGCVLLDSVINSGAVQLSGSVKPLEDERAELRGRYRQIPMFRFIRLIATRITFQSVIFAGSTWSADVTGAVFNLRVVKPSLMALRAPVTLFIKSSVHF